MQLLRHLPNIITLSNLLLGCIGIIFAGWGDLINAARCIYIAAVLDFFDGFAARALKASSPIGKDLDSLSDVVSFGVLPGILLYQLSASVPGFIGLEFIVLILPLLSALRLARFNHDTRQSDKFIGVPTPASAILVASLLIWLFSSPDSIMPQLNKSWVAAFAVALALLLNAPFELFALKFKQFGWQENKGVYVFLIFSLILIISLSYLGLAFVILTYILVSAVLALLKPKIR